MTMQVSQNPSKNPIPQVDNGPKPDHWADAAGRKFQNPWESFHPQSFSDRLSLLFSSIFKFPTPPNDVNIVIPTRKPTWGISAPSQTNDNNPAAESDLKEKIKTTWLGHACFLVEFPSRVDQPKGSRGIRILFDPVFSDRCSPSQWIGPKRFTPPPCKIEDIPEIDAVVISHNHYDHLDTHTIRTLLTRTTRTPHLFAPLGNGPYFESLGVPSSHTHILDWWDSKRLEVNRTDDQDTSTTHIVDITCTPCQHFTGRSPFDFFKSLWASWVVQEVINHTPSSPTDQVGMVSSQRPAVKVFFAGDTGYRAVRDGQDEDNVPVCPVFNTIGNRFGGFDCALIPIGAYLPRQFMSPIHCAPQDSVRLFKDIKAQKAVGMHWGTWVLTWEDVYEPPKRLAEECKKAGISEDAFRICDIGETLWF